MISENFSLTFQEFFVASFVTGCIVYSSRWVVRYTVSAFESHQAGCGQHRER